MDICLGVAATALVLARMPGPVTLTWQHSVERITVVERYRAHQGLLVLDEVRVQGPAAGIEPPPEAQFRDGAWRYRPGIAPMERVLIARSNLDVVLTLAACPP